MEKIDSFKVDHRKLDPGMYLSRTDVLGDHAIRTYDLRFKRPNRGVCIDPSASHTIEHLLATALRNSASGNRVVYFGPMGCLTGFYLIVADMGSDEALDLVKECVAAALALDEIPGASEEECGNARLHNLHIARYILKDYADLLKCLHELKDYPT